MSGKKRTHEQYVEEVKNINKNIMVVGTYVNCDTKILHRCLVDECGCEWYVTPTSILHGTGCPQCNNKKKRITQEEYVKRVHSINKNIMVIGTYVKNYIPIMHKCLAEGCGYEWEVRPADIMSGRGCPVCSGRRIGDPPFYKNSIWSQPMYKKFFEKYLTEEQMKTHTPKSNFKVEAQCPICGRKKMIYLNHLLNSGLGCVCNDNKSYPEKFLYSLFEQAKIDFDIEYNPKWAGRKKYDFYIKDINCIVETHGAQHYRGWNHDKNDILKQQENDAYKKNLALNNNIKYYIEINCIESNDIFIKNNIVDSGLLNLLNINESDIDWNKCCEFASGSFVVIVAKEWNNGCSIKKIKEKTKLSDSTIVKYLKIAAEIGMCDYSREKSIKRSKHISYSTPVYCVELDKVFKTQKETGYSHIYSCCIGDRKTVDKKHWYYLYDKTLNNGTKVKGAISLGLITEEQALNQLNNLTA